MIHWGSRAQKNVTLSSTEAEYLAIANVCKEIMSIKQILQFLNVPLSFPIIVNVDNIGDIFMTDNEGSKGTRHINVKYHFVIEFVKDMIVQIIFVKSKDKIADTFTKNVNLETSDHHHKNYMQDID